MMLFTHLDFCTALLVSLGHFLWQGVAISAIVWIIARQFKTVHARYRVFVAGLLVMASCVPITLFVSRANPSAVPSSETVPLTQASAFPREGDVAVVRDEAPTTAHSSTSAVSPSMIIGEAPAAASFVESAAPFETPISTSSETKSLHSRLVPFVTQVYFLGVALLLMRLAVGLWGGWRLRQSAIPIENLELIAALKRQAQILQIKFVPLLAYCEQVAVPTVVGVLKPTILLPLAVTSGLSLDQVESLLAHELAHLKRYDHLVNLLQRVVESLLFFHPAVWWISHQIRVEREHCCDDLAVSCGAVPIDYAMSLLRVAELSRRRPLQKSCSAVSLLATDGRSSTLRQRIARLLGDTLEPQVRFRHRWPFIASVLTMILIVAGLWDRLDVAATERKMANDEINSEIAAAADSSDAVGEPSDDVQDFDDRQITTQEPPANEQIEEPRTEQAAGAPRPNQISPEQELELWQGTWSWDFSQPWTWPQPIGVGTDSYGRQSEKRWIVEGNQITWISQEGRRINVKFTIDGTKTPKEIEFTFLNGPLRGKKSIGIYEFKGDESRRDLCMTDPGSDAPRPKDISASSFLEQSIIVIHRVPPAPKPTAAQAMKRLQGVWQMTLCDSMTESFGATQPEAKNWQWTINGDEVVWSRQNQLWKMKLEVDPTKSPHQIDLTYLDGPYRGKKCLGMYVFGGVDGQSLMISIQDPGSDAPRPTSISMTGGVMTSLIFLRPSQPNDTERELGSFQGSWILRNFITGKFNENKDPSFWPIPGGKGPDKSGAGSELRWNVKGNEITWSSASGEEIRASFKIDPMQSPKQIDLTFLSGPYKGQTSPGIYQRGDHDPGIYQNGDLLDENILWLCLADPHSKLDRPKEFSYQWGAGRSLLSLYPLDPPGVQTADSQPKEGSLIDGQLQSLRKPALLLPDHWILNSVGFDNGGKELVTASQQGVATIRRWDVAGGKLVSEIKLLSPKHGLAFRQGSLKLSRDCRQVLAITDEFVGVWDAMTGELLKQLPTPIVGNNDTIYLVDATPDFSTIVGSLGTAYLRTTRMYDAYTVVWDGATGAVRRTLTHANGTRTISMTLSTDGKRLVTTSGYDVRVWDVGNGQLIRAIEHDKMDDAREESDRDPIYRDHVWSLKFAPDGEQLAIIDGISVKLVEANSGKFLQRLEGGYRYSNVMSPPLVYSPDGRLLARLGTTSSREAGYVIPVWSTQTGQKLFDLHTNANDACFSNDGRRLAVGISDVQQALSVWNLSSNAKDAEPIGPGPESRVNKVEENGHYRGPKADEFIDKYKPIWSEPIFGIQYGIALTKQPAQFRSGERVPLVFFFRNVSDLPVKVDMRPDYYGNIPKVLDARGKTIDMENVALLGDLSHYVETLQAGESVGPFYASFGLGKNPLPGRQLWHPFLNSPQPGKYTLSHAVSINVSETKEGAPVHSGSIGSKSISLEILD